MYYYDLDSVVKHAKAKKNAADIELWFEEGPVKDALKEPEKLAKLLHLAGPRCR